MAVGTSEGNVPHRPGIDGLRALAVVAVVLYHADVLWIPAGFLGVDIFFVISGYLICSLLLAESVRTGTISLRRFWLRRARRLLPAVVALLIAVTVAAFVAAPDSLTHLRGDLPAALGYVSNWWQIVRGESYFEFFGRPPLLRHLWSLAVEEQFYLAFPLVLMGAIKLVGRRPRLFAVAAATLGAGSAVLMAALWQPGVDPSRIYYGTDTRAVGLCAGVVLACLWPPGHLQADLGRVRRAALDVAGLGSIVALALLMTMLDEFGPAVYRGGFAATAAASCVAIAVAAHPASRFGRVLGLQPFRWVGTRSYAIYLWHWPVFALLRPRLDIDATGWPVLALRLAITVVLAEASWRLVEQPVRAGRLQERWRNWKVPARRSTAVAAVGACATLVFTLAVVRPAPAPSLLSSAPVSSTDGLLDVPSVASAATRVALIGPPSPGGELGISITTAGDGTAEDDVDLVSDRAIAEYAGATTPPTHGTARPAPVGPPAPRPVAAPAPARPTGPAPRPAGTVLAIGDSVMVAAKPALKKASDGKVLVDAAVGRQVNDGLDVLQRYRDRGDLGNVAAVVVHLGTNGPLSEKQFDRMAAIVAGVPRVVVINVRVPKRWENESNDSVAQGVPKRPAMRVGDWKQASDGRGVLGHDGVHPTASGARVYADVMLQQLRDLQQPPPPPPPTEPAPQPAPEPAAAPAPPPESTTTTTTTTTTAPAPPPPETTTTTAPPPPAAPPPPPPTAPPATAPPPESTTTTSTAEPPPAP